MHLLILFVIIQQKQRKQFSSCQYEKLHILDIAIFFNLNLPTEMKQESFISINNQKNQSFSQRKPSVNSNGFEIRREANNFSKYLNSQSSQIIENSKQAFYLSSNGFNLEEKHYMACPELYESYRTEECIDEVSGDHFKIQRYSKGRNQLRLGDVIEVQIPNVVKLTVWSNGDYKLIYNEQVYFWHEEQRSLDKYCVTI